MKSLSIKRALSENTRIQTITLYCEIYDLHQGLGDDNSYYITKHADPDKIYACFSKEMFELIFRD